jgi:dimethylglycine dehydrogenase
MLKQDGRLIGDFTLANVGAEGFLIIGSGVAEDYHMRWFQRQLPADGSVSIVAHGGGLAGLAIAGPRAREVLAAVTTADLATPMFRFMDIKRIPVGLASALVGRVSYTGDLGYEIWCDPAYLVHIFDALMAAGEPQGIRLFGSRALNSLRLEKAYGSWAREYRPIYGPLEAALDRRLRQAGRLHRQGSCAAREGGRWPAASALLRGGCGRRRCHRRRADLEG